MKVTGKIIEHTVRASSFTLMETSTRVTGSMTKPTGLVYTFTLMGHATKAIGKTICSMGMGKRAGPMAPFTRDSTWLARNMEGVSTAGTTVPNTTVNGRKTKSRV